jgi:hypothetical protein
LVVGGSVATADSTGFYDQGLGFDIIEKISLAESAAFN